MQLNELEKTELRALAASESMRADSKRLRDTRLRLNPFMVEGQVDCDRVIEFLTDYNEFLNHPMKPHREFIEKNMKL